MSGGKRTDRISKRDLEVLEFIARFGVVPRSAVAIWAGTARTVTIVRERRLREAGLIEVAPGFGASGRLLICTQTGLHLTGHSDLRCAELSLQRLNHELEVAHLAARLERAGDLTLSEREIRVHERAAGERVFSAPMPRGRFHRADMVRVDGKSGDLEVVEVELTTKGANRLDQILRGWCEAVAEQRVKRVVYRCSPSTRPYVKSAVQRTKTTGAVLVKKV
jgi:hypothetical protein